MTVRQLPNALLLVLLCLSSVSCTRYFFYPDRLLRHLPGDFDIRYQDVWIMTEDGERLHGWLLNPDTTIMGSVLFFHGNAENISTHSHAVYWLVDAGYRVLAVDYRGYGRSSGSPDVPEVFQDILAAELWLTRYLENQPPAPLYLMGQSLGAALSIHYLAQVSPNPDAYTALVSEAGFSRWSTIARELASRNFFSWMLQYPVAWLLSKEYDPVDAIGDISPTPVLLVHSLDDEIISVSHQKQLFEAAAEPKSRYQTIGPHIMGFRHAETRAAVLDFMQSAAASDTRRAHAAGDLHRFSRQK